MRNNITGLCLLLMLAALIPGGAAAQQCPGNPNAIGTKRVISVDPLKLSRVGTAQYPETLPLNEREVVLSFNGGPLPPHTEKVLDALAAECVKAAFFPVGKMALDSPEVLRRAYRQGHTIASMTQTHPDLSKMPFIDAKNEIEDGMASVAAAIGEPHALAPFFRAPYLEITSLIEGYLASRGIMLWGVDFHADDWMEIPPDEVVQRALKRIGEKRKGILVLLDIQAVTAQALPKLLRELKQRNYGIVHVVPAGYRAPAAR